MFDLNYKVKLKQIQQSLNCSRAKKNLSLISKIWLLNLFYFAPTFVSIFCFVYQNPQT